MNGDAESKPPPALVEAAAGGGGEQQRFSAPKPSDETPSTAQTSERAGEEHMAAREEAQEFELAADKMGEEKPAVEEIVAERPVEQNTAEEARARDSAPGEELSAEDKPPIDESATDKEPAANKSTDGSENESLEVKLTEARMAEDKSAEAEIDKAEHDAFATAEPKEGNSEEGTPVADKPAETKRQSTTPPSEGALPMRKGVDTAPATSIASISPSANMPLSVQSSKEMPSQDGPPDGKRPGIKLKEMRESEPDLADVDGSETIKKSPLLRKLLETVDSGSVSEVCDALQCVIAAKLKPPEALQQAIKHRLSKEEAACIAAVEWHAIERRVQDGHLISEDDLAKLREWSALPNSKPECAALRQMEAFRRHVQIVTGRAQPSRPASSRSSPNVHKARPAQSRNVVRTPAQQKQLAEYERMVSEGKLLTPIELAKFKRLADGDSDVAHAFSRSTSCTPSTSNLAHSSSPRPKTAPRGTDAEMAQKPTLSSYKLKAMVPHPPPSSRPVTPRPTTAIISSADVAASKGSSVVTASFVPKQRATTPRGAASARAVPRQGASESVARPVTPRMEATRPTTSSRASTPRVSTATLIGRGRLAELQQREDDGAILSKEEAAELARLRNGQLSATSDRPWSTMSSTTTMKLSPMWAALEYETIPVRKKIERVDAPGPGHYNPRTGFDTAHCKSQSSLSFISVRGRPRPLKSDLPEETPGPSTYSPIFAKDIRAGQPKLPLLGAFGTLPGQPVPKRRGPVVLSPRTSRSFASKLGV